MDLYALQCIILPKQRRESKKSEPFRNTRTKDRQIRNITREKMLLVSIVQNDKELSSTYRKEKLSKSFEGMQRHGLKKLHGKNGFDRPRRELLLSLLS